MEPKQPQSLGPTARFKVVVLQAQDPEAVAQLVSQRVGRSLAEVRKMVAMAPAVVADNMEAIPAQDLVVTIKGLGADAEKRLIPSSVKCPFHPDQPGRAVCKLCGKVMCSVCLKESKGQPICADCRGETDKVETPFPWGKVVILVLMAGAAAFGYYWFTRPRPQFAWDRPYKVAIVGFMVELPPEWRGWVSKFNESGGGEYVDLRNHTLPDMVGWFQREYNRYGGTMPDALDLKIFGPFDMMEPPPPAPAMDAGFLDKFFTYRKFKSYFNKLNDNNQLDLSGFDSVIYVQFVTGDFDGFMESYPSRRYNISLVNAYMDINLVETDIMIVIHELMHLLNAKDHYDYTSRQPIYPEGYVQPFEKPAYPQNYSEIMAGSIPLDETSSTKIRGLASLRVGIYTAAEIGWMSKEKLAEMIQNEKTPDMN